MTKRLNDLIRIEKIPIYGEGFQKNRYFGHSIVELLNLAEKNLLSSTMTDLEWYKTVEEIGEDQLEWDRDDYTNPQRILYWSALYNTQVRRIFEKSVKNKFPYLFIKNMATGMGAPVQYYRNVPCHHYFQKNEAFLFNQLEITTQHKIHEELDREFLYDNPSKGTVCRFTIKGSSEKEIEKLEIPENAKFYERILPKKDFYLDVDFTNDKCELDAKTMNEYFAETFIFYCLAAGQKDWGFGFHSGQCPRSTAKEERCIQAGILLLKEAGEG